MRKQFLTVATVLLFGGVISIIGLMMTSMLPVINELEGSIERNDMASQMKLGSKGRRIVPGRHARRL